jgi:biopolymer transport protein ExbB
MIEPVYDYLQSVGDYFAGGGPVMIPLTLVSLVMWALIINRAIFFRKLYKHNMNRKLAGELVRDNRMPDFQAYPGAVSLFVGEFLKKRSNVPELDAYILDEVVMSLNASLDRYLALIGVLAGIAPLLGLLGTVLGMVNTFEIISFFGTGNARALSGGISEALITTETGLVVAIPGLYLSNFFKRRADRLKQRIASVGIYLKQYV